MRWSIRRRRFNGRQEETVQTQLKILRAHFAALVSDVSSLRIQLQRSNDLAATMLERLDRQERTS